MKRARILVVEDERITADDLRATLHELGHQVVAIAHSAEEALERVEALRPELVLLDIRLAGGQDGVAVGEEVGRRHHIPIIYLTAYADEETVKRAARTEAYGYLLKPFSEQELRTTIQIALYRSESERSIRAAREEAERASQAKSELLSRTSHELRTPLNAILGFGQLLELDPTVEDQESVRQILAAGRHLLGLIDEVLDLATIEAGRINLSMESTSVAEVLRQSLDLVRHLAAGRHIAIDADEPLRAQHRVLADPRRLRQVLLNLLSNAIKFNRAGGSVHVSSEETAEDRVRVSVRDTGPGLAAEKLARLFTPFERLDAELQGVTGTGLGLALSRGLVESMRGAIGVESVPGEGSTFWVEVPRSGEPGGEATPGEGAETETSAPRPAAPRDVLYIDDNLANLRLVERILARHLKARMLPALSGEAGLHAAREARPHLILLDVRLPDLPGIEVMRRLQQDPSTREIPVVVVSSDAHPEHIGEMLAQGASAYLTKPLQIPQFVAVVAEHLRAAE